MSQKISKGLKRAVVLFDEMAKPDFSNMKTVDDHYICYGKDVPLCGQPLGKKGLIKKIEYITCPKCLSRMGNLKVVK